MAKRKGSKKKLKHIICREAEENSIEELCSFDNKYDRFFIKSPAKKGEGRGGGKSQPRGDSQKRKKESGHRETQPLETGRKSNGGKTIRGAKATKRNSKRVWSPGQKRNPS